MLSLQAQTRQQMGGVYYAYPEGPSAKTGTFGKATYMMSDSLSVPQGYAPFYISHYGRHGSRWMPKDDRYVWICKHFEDESNLTPLGLQVKGSRIEKERQKTVKGCIMTKAKRSR